MFDNIIDNDRLNSLSKQDLEVVASIFGLNDKKINILEPKIQAVKDLLEREFESDYEIENDNLENVSLFYTEYESKDEINEMVDFRADLDFVSIQVNVDIVNNRLMRFYNGLLVEVEHLGDNESFINYMNNTSFDGETALEKELIKLI